MERTANIVISHNPFKPFKDRQIDRVQAGYSIQDWADNNEPLFEHPVVCLFNGDALMRADWKGAIVFEDSVVVFYKLPLGGNGGGFDLGTFILGVALVVVGAYFYNPGLVQYGLVTLGLGVAVLGSGLLPAPEVPSADQGNQLAKPSPTYSLSGQGNIARLGSSIPVVYGRHRVFPDFAAEPWAEFIDNNQFLYHLLVIGQGSYDVEGIKIEDSDINDFKEITWRIIGPFEDVTRRSFLTNFNNLSQFPNPNVVNVLEVSGQELILDNLTPANILKHRIGPFTINPAETEINKIQLDFVAPRGLYDLDDDGDFTEISVFIDYAYQKIDDAGDNVGSPAGDRIEIKGKTNEQIRRTIDIVVPRGRYKIRMNRAITNYTATQVADKMVWQGCKGFLVDGATTFGDTTMLVVKMRATNNLSSRSSRKINCVVTRKINTWNPTDGWSRLRVASTSIVWAIADALRSQVYGAKWPIEQIDLQGLYELDQILIARGDTFNGVFDRKLSMWEALKLIARVGRCSAIIQGGLFRLIRDRKQTTPVAMFTPRNIKKGSFSVEYSLASEDTVDGVEIEYINPVTWKPAKISVDAAGNKPLNPAKIKLFGCTNAIQARREAIYLARNNIYRRKLIKFTTELDGHIPTFGDLVVVSHDLPNWGVSGDVTSITLDGTITLSEDIDISNTGTRKRIAFRRLDGSESGAYQLTKRADFAANEYRLAEFRPGNPAYRYVPISDGAVRVERTSRQTGTDEAFLFDIHFSDKYERTQFVFGEIDTWRQLGVVKSIRPRGESSVELQILSEDVRVHEDI